MATRNNNSELSDKYLPLTVEEDAVIHGTLLGDAHLQKRGEGSYRLKIDHSIDQKEYVQWKYRQLKRLCETTQGPTTTTQKGYEFYTSSGKYLKRYHDLYYKEVKTGEKVKYVKTITEELIKVLPMHPLVLATFFMDDGDARNDCYAGKIATQGFSKEGSELLCSYLAKWGIAGRVVVHTEKSGQFYITLPATPGAFAKLVDIIAPIVKEIPDMVYKLNERYKPRND